MIVSREEIAQDLMHIYGISGNYHLLTIKPACFSDSNISIGPCPRCGATVHFLSRDHDMGIPGHIMVRLLILHGNCRQCRCFCAWMELDDPANVDRENRVSLGKLCDQTLKQLG